MIRDSPGTRGRCPGQEGLVLLRHRLTRNFHANKREQILLYRSPGFVMPSASAAISRALSPVMLPWPAMR